MKTIKLSVSWHPQARQFVRYVGNSEGRNGVPKPHSFYLGDDEPVALALAMRLKSDWSAIKNAGASAWPLTWVVSYIHFRPSFPTDH